MSLSPNVMGRPLVVRDATGQDVWIEPGLGSPDGVLARPKGSIFYRLDVAQMWQNTDGAVAWSLNVTLDTPLGGDLTGTVDAATVVGLAGVLLDTAPPVNGDVLIFNNVTDRWEHTSLTFGGGPPSGPAGGSLAGVYPDPSLSAVGTAGTYGSASSVPVLTTTLEGRVSGVTPTSIAIAQSQVADLVTDLGLKADEAITISAGAGLSGGGDLTANRTISMPNVGTSGSYGGAATVPVITTDAQGRVSVVTPTAITPAAISAVPDARQVLAGAGLSGGGALTSDVTLSLTNVGTPSTYGSATQVPVLTTDAQGRVTGVVNTTISGVAPGGAASGDLTGTYPSPTLVAAGTAGTYGSSTAVPVLTTDAQGRVTGVVNTTIAFPTPPLRPTPSWATSPWSTR